MTRASAAALLICLTAGCGQPRAGLTIDTGPGGVAVTPSLSGNIGGLSVSVRG